MDENKYPHVLEALTNTPWAIKIEALNEMHDIVLERQSGVKADKAAIEAKLGRDLNNSQRYSVEKGTAIIPIYGPITKKMSLFAEISGGTSTEVLERDIQTALDDKKIKSIFLDINSPGGSVFGPFELSDFIYANRGRKPIIAFANGSMNSGAYLIGSAADEIYAYNTSQAGSIGVVAILTERSAQDKVQGITRTVITAGKYKAVGNSAEPLTKEGREYLQSHVDYYNSLFIEAVARNRDISIDDALKMADGKVFIGQQAKDIGLVDHIGNFNLALSRATKRRRPMDRATFRAENPDLYAALHDEFTEEGKKAGIEVGKATGYNEGFAAGQKEGVDTGTLKGMEDERTRIAEIKELGKGMEDKAEEYIKSGASVEEATKGLLMAHQAKVQAEKDAEKDLKDKKTEQLVMGAQDTTIIPDTKTNPEMSGDASEQLDRLTIAKMQKEGITNYTEAFNKIQAEHPKLATQYLEDIRPVR